MSSRQIVQQSDVLRTAVLGEPVRESFPVAARCHRIDSGKKHELSEVFCQMLMDVAECAGERSHSRTDKGKD